MKKEVEVHPDADDDEKNLECFDEHKQQTNQTEEEISRYENDIEIKEPNPVNAF